MSWLWNKMQSEPNALAELVRLFIYMLLGFELLRWTDPQIALVLSFVSGLLTFLTRQRVIPTATILQAGHTPEAIKATAAVNVAAATTEPKP